MKYKILIDDNAHYMDESYRREYGVYENLEEAINVCKRIVRKSLREFYSSGMEISELVSEYALYGDDPFILGAEGVPFSARNYALEAAEDMCG